MASQAMTVIRFSMASWAMTFCWTACGQPNRTWPGLIFSRSWGIGLGKDDEIAASENGVPRLDRNAALLEIRVRQSVVLAVTGFEDHGPAKRFRIPDQVVREDGDPPFIFLVGRSDDADAHDGHPLPASWVNDRPRRPGCQGGERQDGRSC